VTALTKKVDSLSQPKSADKQAATVDASAVMKIEGEIKQIKDQIAEDSKYMKTKVDHVTTENV
jgi:hypothetical protein